MSEKSIDQNIFPEGLGTARCVLLPEVNGRGQYNFVTYISVYTSVRKMLACENQIIMLFLCNTDHQVVTGSTYCSRKTTR